ncbi:hypothetical protein [Zhongshania borealis]|uniref:Uncharacterized protein n=1 Tax=Zhongshania borealis TaxID=889488 RepID=A0ABP7X1H7_9GAMM
MTALSLWMGLLKTERSLKVFAEHPELYAEIVAMAESPEFPGRVIDALWGDPERLRRSGKVYYAAELALEYNVQDIQGEQPPSPRGMLGDPTEFNDACIQ